MKGTKRPWEAGLQLPLLMLNISKLQVKCAASKALAILSSRSVHMLVCPLSLAEGSVCQHRTIVRLCITSLVEQQRNGSGQHRLCKHCTGHYLHALHLI